MIIEVNLRIRLNEEEGNAWNCVFNTAHVIAIHRFGVGEKSELCIDTTSKLLSLKTYSDGANKAIYDGFMVALQGQEVNFDEWGYIKPLLNERREELHKYMLYLQTINDMTRD